MISILCVAIAGGGVGRASNSEPPSGQTLPGNAKIFIIMAKIFISIIVTKVSHLGDEVAAAQQSLPHRR
jgi:hypothetical protein